MLLNIKAPQAKKDTFSNKKSDGKVLLQKRSTKLKLNENQINKKTHQSSYEKINDQILGEDLIKSSNSRPPKSSHLNLPKKKNNISIDQETLGGLLDFHGIEKEELFTETAFDGLPLNKCILRSLQENNYVHPTIVQLKSIPSVLEGKNCIIKSETGSGKTLTYLVPLLSLLQSKEPKISRSDGIYVIIISPTHELCTQISETCQKLTKRSIWIVNGILVGGEDIQSEKSRIRKGLNIVIATPGRLLYHLNNTTSLKLNNLQYLVFEECDRCLDMGFKKEVSQILNIIHEKKTCNIQKILISASFNKKIEELCIDTKNEEFQYVGFEKDDEINNENENELKVPSTLKQMYSLVPEGLKLVYLGSIIKWSHTIKMIIFVMTCDQTNYLADLFNTIFNGDTKFVTQTITKLHGSMNPKEREENYKKFKNSEHAILIATDVACRGLDFPDVKVIIVYDPPQDKKDYVNRIGRTARINKHGTSLLILHEQENGFVESLIKKGYKLHNYDYKIPISFLNNYLKESQIKTPAHEFMMSMYKSYIKKDKDNYIKAKRAVVSSFRAYARLKDKNNFNLKSLNLTSLSRAVGLGQKTKKQSSKEIKSQAYQDASAKLDSGIQGSMTEKKNDRRAARPQDTIRNEFY